jgi:hypothetical protein
MPTETPKPRWHTVAHAGPGTAILVFAAQRNWYGRRDDARRASITETGNGAILEITEPHGWGVEHRSEHVSARAARAAYAKIAT